MGSHGDLCGAWTGVASETGGRQAGVTLVLTKPSPAWSGLLPPNAPCSNCKPPFPACVLAPLCSYDSRVPPLTGKPSVEREITMSRE